MNKYIDKKSWKTAWNHFYERAREQVDDLDWCWYTEALLLYEEEKENIEEALVEAFEDTSWWSDWNCWREQFEELRPNSLTKESSIDRRYLPSDLPTPPEEPSDIWEKTQTLLDCGDRFEAIGAAVVRLVLAEGRATRELQSSKQ